MKKVRLSCEEGEKEIYQERLTHAAPPEMLAFSADVSGADDITIHVREV